MSDALNSKNEISGRRSGIVETSEAESVLVGRKHWSLVLPLIFFSILTIVSIAWGGVLLSRFDPPDQSSARGFSGKHASETSSPVRDFPLEIVGNQFKWNFRYPGPDGVLGSDDDQVAENNELFLPKNCTARVRLKSDDYIYIFSVSATKRDRPESSEAGDVANSNRNTYFISSSGRTKQRCPSIPNHPAAMLLETMGDDQIQLLISPGCGFRLIHDPEMGKITVTDDHDYRRLLPSTTSIE